MNTDKKEYEFYKSFCNLQSIKPVEDEIYLVESLKNKGLELIDNDGHYNLLEAISILSESQIRTELNYEINKKISLLEVVFETDSTNHQISSHSINSNYSILVAEYQNKGQGRRLKKWSSPLGTNLYFSIQCHLVDTTNSSFIPLIAARAICNALQSLGIKGCQIKWPNDIYLDGMKVAGILSESRYCQNKGLVVVVGIGLNVNMCSEIKIDQQWTSLKKSNNKNYNRNSVLSTLLNFLLADFENLVDFNIESFKQDWNLLDYLRGKTIHIADDKLNYSAIAMGLAEDGALIIQHDNQTQKVYSGDISVKLIDSSL